jgi:hypothetical protein
MFSSRTLSAHLAVTFSFCVVVCGTSISARLLVYLGRQSVNFSPLPNLLVRYLLAIVFARVFIADWKPHSCA